MVKRSVPTDLLTGYVTWLTLQGRKPATLRSHVSYLRRLYALGADFAREGSVPSKIEEFILSGKYSTSHVNNNIGVSRVFARYLKEKGLPVDESIFSIKDLKDKYKPKATMSDEEIEAFLSLPPKMVTHKNPLTGGMSTRPINRKRHEFWTMFFSIMAYTGMRPGEVAKLKVEHIDFGRSAFMVGDTKTNDNRVVPIPPNISQRLLEWTKERQKGYLFPSSRPDGHCSNVEWHYNFHERIKRLGIVRLNLTPYSLRHSLITRLLEEDVNIFKVQKIVGHKDIKTTSVYTHLTTKDIQEAIRKHPLILKATRPREIARSILDFIKRTGIENDPRFKVKQSIEEGKVVIEITWDSEDDKG